MPDPNVHTVPHGDGWANELEGAGTILATFDTEAEAVTAGRDAAMASKVEHLIHNADGTISERNSYGNDPYPPKG